MNKIRITDDKKSKKDNFFIIAFSICLLILFILGLVKVYEKGYIEGLDTFCDYDIGINQDGEYICYNNTPILSEEYSNYGLGWEG